MDIYRIPLTILFKEQNPYTILENYFGTRERDELLEGYRMYNKNKAKSYETLPNENIFRNLYAQIDHEVTKEEIHNIYCMMDEFMKQDLTYHIIKQSSVYKLLQNYNETILEAGGDFARCKYKSLLKWRTVTLALEPDLLLSSFLVCNDMERGYRRRDYNWDTIIKSDNIRLHDMLMKGMAENHFHLKGSAPVFLLVWIALMNYPLKKHFWYGQERLSKDIHDELDISALVFMARIIRILLFKTLRKGTVEKDCDMYRILKGLIQDKNENNRNNISSELRKINYLRVQQEIDSLQFTYGDKIKYRGNERYVDYAFMIGMIKTSRSTRLFLGERAFQYQCFKLIYSSEDEDTLNFVGDLFYAYLIIKNKVRAEFIQNNNRIGFSNFYDYQNRKTAFLPKHTILKDSVEPSAIVTSVKSQNIVSLEARIAPEENVRECAQYIKDIDRRIDNNVFNDRGNYWMRAEKLKRIDTFRYQDLSIEERKLYFGADQTKRVDEKLKEKYYYVYHFIKVRDTVDYTKLKDDCLPMQIRCRHYKYRRLVKKQALFIYEMREHSQNEARRIFGIDACNNELDARPEVYGQVFRFLKAHLPQSNRMLNLRDCQKLQRLRATYHVGEEFLDVADGLRAIDEAIEYLDLAHGDRIGHAIVLGIDAREWYRRRSNRVYLTKQDILDNTAWLIAMIKYYNITVQPNAIGKLSSVYNQYYSEIFMSGNAEHCVSRTTNIPADIYYESWKLRGDNPEYYNPSIPKSHGVLMDKYALRDKYNETSGLVKELYYRYHYDIDVKCEGAKKKVFRIPAYYVDVVQEVQRNLQVKIRSRGIGIETNPTSNVLISSFKRYDKHPILNMYSKELEDELLKENPQLFASINTDDQGVFDTLLENEYALMAIALEKVKDRDGNAKYDQSKIYAWLDEIRQMGVEQSFRYTVPIN